jgi:hypothetical protein
LDNKDYDGDETTFMLMLDHYVEDMFSNFEPHHNLLQLDSVLELSKNASMTDAIVASASEWLTQSRRDALKNQPV